jgi:uncharacterized repeat protein (TIGR01451 family)
MYRFARTGALAAACVFALQLGSMRPAAAVNTYISETFTGPTTAESFNLGTPKTGAVSNGPCLTAGTGAASTIPACPHALNPANGGVNGTLPDPSGQGALRLTDNENNQASFVIITQAVPTSGGVQATFDLYSYGGTGADGIGFLVLDGTAAAPTTSGANGGSFGYAQKVGTGCCDSVGIANGYFGIGFDEYGNYQNPTEGRVGGPGAVPESVGIRGYGNASTTQYNYVTGTAANFGIGQSIDVRTSAVRPTKKNVRLTVSPGGLIKVDIDFTGTQTNYVSVIPSFNITTVAGQPALPTSLRFGFSGSTGGSTNFHEIQNFVATGNPPQLSIAKVATTPSFTGNQNGAYTITVSNSSLAGPTTQSVQVVDTLPVGETYVSATGTNWLCSVSGVSLPQTVTCNYQAATVASGSSAPPITLTVKVAANAPNPIVNSTSVTTADGVPATVTTTASTPVVDTPLVQLYKKILQILTYGPTPSAATTPRTITPTPDPTNIPGMLGTANSPQVYNVYPRDTLTYGIYFLNAGGVNAIGPAITDPLDAQLAYVAGSQTFTCCANPTSTLTDTFAQTGQTLKWTFGGPLVPYVAPGSGNMYQGRITYQATVR